MKNTQEILCYLDIIKLIPSLIAVIPSLIVGMITAYIAYNQYRVNKDKLRLDLFEKRLEAYEKLQEYFNYFIRKGCIDNEAIIILSTAHYKSVFLFGSEVTEYIDEVRDKAIEMRRLRIKLHNHKALPIGEERNKVSDRDSELFEWHLDQQRDSQKLYIKYLKFI